MAIKKMGSDWKCIDIFHGVTDTQTLLLQWSFNVLLFAKLLSKPWTENKCEHLEMCVVV